MVRDRDVEVLLRGWLEEQGRQAPSTGFVNAVLRRSAATGQQPGWFPAIRVAPVSRPPTPRLVMVLAVLALLAAAVIGTLAVLSQVRPAEPEGRIVFTDADVAWIVSIDGSGMQRLTQGAVFGRVAYSPDRRLIAFSGGRGVSTIYVANADGSRVRPLTEPDIDTVYGDPAWSPDGSLIVFARMERSGGWLAHLHVMNADGTQVRQLTDGPNGDFQPAWSPDGSVIAFVRETELPGHRFVSDLYAVRPDGMGIEQLTSDAGIEIGPVWSPDGRRLAFSVRAEPIVADDPRATGQVAALPDYPPYDIAMMNADGTERRMLTAKGAPYGYAPAWSPDGRHLVFSAYWPDLLGTEEPYAVYIIAADGSGLQRVACCFGEPVDPPTWTE